MKIELHEITVRDVADQYADNAEEGVVGYGGKLNIRPKYQREFVYDEKKRNAVLDTIRKGFPLNVIYWVKNEDGSFEVTITATDADRFTASAIITFIVGQQQSDVMGGYLSEGPYLSGSDVYIN